MKNLLLITVVFTLFTSCKNAGIEKIENTKKNEFKNIINDNYELSQPTDTKAVLVLFGGYPERAKDIKQEFTIFESAMENGIAVVYMNYNQKLWLEENEKIKLVEDLDNIFEENNLPKTKTYLGGFSSGGNVALLISDFLVFQKSEMTPKGVFVIDSPINLAGLYKSSVKNLERDFSELSLQESTWLLETLGKNLGNPLNDITKYENYSIYTSQTENFDNIKNLKNVKIRFYSEPDTTWWKQNRMADFDQMNAFYIEQLSKLLKKSSFKQIEYIATENKGYRANGERNPHSWSIVDKKELIEWITK